MRREWHDFRCVITKQQFHYFMFKQTRLIQIYKFEIFKRLTLWNLCSNLFDFIMVVGKKINIAFNIPLPIVLDDSFSVFKYSSFSRGYHVNGNPLWVMNLCTEKKKTATSMTSMHLR